LAATARVRVLDIVVCYAYSRVLDIDVVVVVKLLVVYTIYCYCVIYDVILLINPEKRRTLGRRLCACTRVCWCRRIFTYIEYILVLVHIHIYIVWAAGADRY